MAVFIAPPGSATSGSGEGWGLRDDACLARQFGPVQRLINFVVGRGGKGSAARCSRRRAFWPRAGGSARLVW